MRWGLHTDVKVLVTAEAENDGLFRGGLVLESPVCLAVFVNGLGLRRARNDL
jgi:hypothetical protein